MKIRGTGGKLSAAYAGAAVLALVAAIPVIAQQGPKSLLPPGFGDSAPEEKPTPDTPQTPAPRPANAPATPPGLALDLSDIGGPALPGVAANASAMDDTEELTPEELAAQQAKYDLPDSARRSLERIGPLTSESGGFGANAFGVTSGKYLSALMQSSRAPFVSRWGSILLRRALLSATDTPSDVNGADWAAERAWLLVRMGEADAARMMVQSVDTDRFTPRLSSVAMQVYLAAADPAGLCPIHERAAAHDNSPGWKMAGAICASFTGEQGTASAILNQAQRRGKLADIDYHLTEKIVGAGVNSRRSVKIEWDGVDQLSAWRFGLATAANVEIPAPLLDSASTRVRAWQARAPMLSLPARLTSVETAARLGVFSSSALVDYYSQLAASDDAPVGFQPRSEALASAYSAATVGARIAAMQELWGDGKGDPFVAFLSLARAAAMLPVADASAADISNLIAAMLSAGYDSSAARWAIAGEQLGSSDGATGWALLAVGAPRIVVDVSASTVGDFASANGRRGQMLVAGLAGLSRISSGEAASAASDADLTLGRRTRWSDAISSAAARGEKGTVAVLAAIGMQTASWGRMPPEHLFHIVAALHRVGLDPEARMIAAEAIMRT